MVCIRFACCAALTVLVLLISGCNILRPASQFNLPVADFLPADWTPLGELRPVNIDDDPSTEFLLLYTYDSGSGDPEQPNGPVGAVMYDSQADAQELVDFRSYRILPSYDAPTGHGIIASPEQRNSITTRPVTRTNPDEMAPSPAQLPSEATPPDATAVPRADELILFGGDTHMTVIWWQNAVHGYGVTQVYAPGGLHSFDYDGVPGTDEQTAARPVRSVRGFFPLHDRSLLCDQMAYVRMLDPQNEPTDDTSALYNKAIRYQPMSEGLRFCHGAPTHPYYPEGVTLAYLLDPTPNSALWHPGLTQQERTRIYERFQALVEPSGAALDGPLHVADVRAYRTVPVAPGAGATSQSLLDTRACAAIVTPDGERALLFTLRYVPPGVPTGVADRLFIADIAPIPAPAGGPPVDCGQIIENGVPERLGAWRGSVVNGQSSIDNFAPPPAHIGS